MSDRKRVVLYYPERGNPDLGQPYSADLLPLEFLHIAAPAMQQGFEIDVVDSMIEERPHEAVLARLPGAFAFGSTCIIGYQVADGAALARKVRAARPELPIIWGGWFPSVAPQLYLSSGLADAVCLGQGEVTFSEWLCALRDGRPATQVPGLALWVDGRVERTAPRKVVPLADLPEPVYDLVPVDRYLDIQERQARTAKVRYRFPDPPGFSMENPYRAISFLSSFGCPEDCSFCCSPGVTGRRWVALPAKTVVDRLERLRRAHDFHIVRFQDANFGVNPKRVREFCQELLARRLDILWNATIEVETIMRMDDETLDLMRDSGCHMMWVGAETATEKMQAYVRKHIKQGHARQAMERMWRRGVKIGLFWIIGYPNETEESMRATLDLAADIKYHFPNCTSEVLLFRPLPGTVCAADAERAGYEMPLDFDTWGRMVEYKFENATFDALPPRIRRDFHRYSYLVPWYDGLVRGRSPYKRFLRHMAGLRLKHQWYGLPLEFKLHDWGRRALQALGFERRARLEARAAGVALEGAAPGAGGAERTAAR
ncbi:MAG: radical SAM protein [Planctomycetes bacterium]|nr:radical SAM protein [Planctomycetota bacterium]